MSGEITIRERDWKAEFIPLAIAFAVALLVTAILSRFGNVSPLARGIAGGAIAYVIARATYGALRPAGTLRRIAWTLTDADLTLDGKIIPRPAIRAVYCWPNRDAFGHTRPGWIVNIETGKHNALLRSVSGERAEASAAELETLVRALGGQVPV